MINPFKEINWNPDSAALKSFGRTILSGCVVIAAILGAWTGWGKALAADTFRLPAILIGIGLVVFILTRIPGRAALPVYRLWFAVGASIGIVISNLFLIIFYYLFFTPLALALRLAGRDPLKLKKPTRNTNWQEHRQIKDLERYFKQY